MGRAWRWWGVWVVVVCLMGAGRGVAECKDEAAKGRVWNPDAMGQAWTWKDADGCVRTRAELDEVLRLHQLWIETHYKKGQQANLVEANLTGANLTGAFLPRADLVGAYLRGADLTEAYLVGADLTSAQLDKADVTWADLSEADLTEAGLTEADLTGTHLYKADLAGAHLDKADLTYADLRAADLTGAHLHNADLTEATLGGADLTGADLDLAGFIGAHLSGAVFTKSDLSYADLTGTHLSGMDFTGADLSYADLTGADFSDADLTGAGLRKAYLAGALYEPKARPLVETIAFAVGLDQLRHGENPTPLVELRKGFQDGGFVQPWRKVTASLRRSDLDLSWKCQGANCDPKSLRYKLRYTLPKFLNWALFDWTCAWGSDWSHPFVLLGWLCLVCGPVYWVGMHFGRVGGIYRIVLDKVVATKTATEVVTRVEPGVRWVGRERLRTRTVGEAVRARSPKLRWRLVGMALRREWQALRLAFLFSVLSALDIGFHEFNVGVWARMLLARDFNLKARGWMRVVGGLQSLVGLGLVALSLLSYFGHPFD